MSERDPELQDDPQLRAADARLASYQDATDDAPSPGFADWVMRSIESEPVPRRGFAAAFASWYRQPGPMRTLAQAVVVVAIVAAGIGSAIAIGNLGGLNPGPGGEPTPISTPATSASPSPAASPTPEPTTAPTESPDESDDELETPGPGETPDSD